MFQHLRGALYVTGQTESLFSAIQVTSKHPAELIINFLIALNGVISRKQIYKRAERSL